MRPARSSWPRTSTASRPSASAARRWRPPARAAWRGWLALGFGVLLFGGFLAILAVDVLPGIRDALLLDAEIIEAGDTDEVSQGHVIQIRYEGDDEAERYLIGSIEEKGSAVEVLTPGSPLGKALLGAKVGDWVEFESPTGATLKVEVVEIEA